MQSHDVFPWRAWQGFVALFFVGWSFSLFAKRLVDASKIELLDLFFLMPLLLLVVLRPERQLLYFALRSPQAVRGLDKQAKAWFAIGGYIAFLLGGILCGAFFYFTDLRAHADFAGIRIVAVAVVVSVAAFFWARHLRNAS
jgi:hypothetical protein